MARTDDPFQITNDIANNGPRAKAEPGSGGGPGGPGGPTVRAERANPRATRARHQLKPLDEMPDDTEDDRLRIPRSEFPDDFDLQWVTDSIFGQPQPNHRSRFERRGWEPVHGDDFDNKFEGRFCPYGHKGEIGVDGMVLMARPMAWSNRARQEDRQRASEAVMIKEKQLRGGEIDGVKMDGGAQHPSALGVNRIRRSYERLQVPKE
jgi:hypothetical protein